MRDYIEINKEMIPYQFNILLADNWFELYVNYNKTADLFTVSLYKDDELICTEPLIFGTPLFRDIYQPEKFPAIVLVPSGANETVITYDNLGETVFLTVDDEGEATDEVAGGFALAVASGSSGTIIPPSDDEPEEDKPNSGGTTDVKDGVSFTDRNTGEKYTLYVNDGKLTMEGEE